MSQVVFAFSSGQTFIRYNKPMEKQSFDKILAIEQDIQEALAEERQQALEWLESVKQQICAAEEGELARLERVLEEAVAAAQEAAKSEMQRDLQEAEQRLKHAQLLTEDRLKDAVKQHILTILPEAADDRPHGKN